MPQVADILIRHARLDDVKAGRGAPGSGLILENIDRLSREEIDEARELFRPILRAGVDVVTERPERRYTRKSLNNFAEVPEVKFARHPSRWQAPRNRRVYRSGSAARPSFSHFR